MALNNILTISELTRRIKNTLETSFNNVTVEGEISNFKRHSSGHLYFTLKDGTAQLQAVIWRARAAHLLFTPQDGMKVIAKGNITVYETRGQYQLDVIQLQPLGIGELQIAFEKLKQKLAAEGLFNSEHKKELPEYPERIGIITSPTGAALQDMLNIINRRFAAVDVILYPVKVQGDGAAQEIADAIKAFNKYRNIDVLIVGRGGGSLEDLWAFNEEIVARAIFASKIPIVSAVGHEIDFTIADFVADLRAPTPSAAAELILRDSKDIIENIRNYCYTMEQNIRSIINNKREKIVSLVSSYSFNQPKDLLRQYSQRVDELERNLDQVVLHRISIFNQQSVSLSKRLSSLNPHSILQRGFTIIYRDDKIVDRAVKLNKNDKVSIKFHDGDKPAKVF
jgi:exodeoxyribonuclease VII large subunit